MKSFIFGGLFILAMNYGIHARDWGFSKDTVYTWKPGGDSVLLENYGTDTLKIDTASALITGHLLGTISFYVSSDSGNTNWSLPSPYPSKMVSLSVAKNKKDILYNFNVMLIPLAKPVAKRATIAAVDTISARLIFNAAFSRGSDTLIIISMQPSGILPRVINPDHSLNERYYNPLGRVQGNTFSKRNILSIPLFVFPVKYNGN